MLGLVYILIPITYEYVTLHGKGALRLLISCSSNRKIIVDYLGAGGGGQSHRILKSGRRRQKRETRRDGSIRRTPPDIADLKMEEWGYEPKNVDRL